MSTSTRPSRTRDRPVVNRDCAYDRESYKDSEWLFIEVNDGYCFVIHTCSVDSLCRRTLDCRTARSMTVATLLASWMQILWFDIVGAWRCDDQFRWTRYEYSWTKYFPTIWCDLVDMFKPFCHNSRECFIANLTFILHLTYTVIVIIQAGICGS